MSLLRSSPLLRASRSLCRAAVPRASGILARPYSAAAAVEHKHYDTSHFAPQEHSGSSLLVNSNWTTLEEQPVTAKSIKDILESTIPVVRQRNFLSKEECAKLVNIVHEYAIGSYDQDIVFPPLGSVGLSAFQYLHEPDKYLDGAHAAYSLQRRFKEEAGVDVLGRVIALLQAATGLETRVAREGDKEYFAGLLRVVNNYIQIHADYGVFDAPGWEIGNVVGQVSWNILLKQVPGGDTIIYDRQWQGEADDQVYRKDFPRYAYKPTTVQGRIFKALAPIEGDLTFFNSRNFHEVKPCDMKRNINEDVVRYTLSSFVGLLPAKGGKPPTLVLWS